MDKEEIEKKARARNPEFKEKAAEAFKAGVAAAKMLGGIACDLGKKGYSAARDKAKELGEKVKEANRKAQEEETERRRMYEEQMKEAPRRSDENRCASKYCGDPEDKSFLMSYGWLFFTWWVMNFVYTGFCLWWYVSARDNFLLRDNAWIAFVVWLLALLFNRLIYEGAVGFFEMVRHLRQIRDELQRHNMREDEKWDSMKKQEHPNGTQGENVAQNPADGEDMSHKDEHAEGTTH